MTQKLFLLAISFLLLRASCPTNFNPNSFQEASSELEEFINEYFLEQNNTFFPTKSSKNIELKGLEQNLTQAIITLKEPTKLPPLLAFNTYNDLLGNLFYDYDNTSYKLEFIPYEQRAYFNGVYFGVSVRIYGIVGDNSKLNHTMAKVELINYTPWVKEFIRCKSKK